MDAKDLALLIHEKVGREVTKAIDGLRAAFEAAVKGIPPGKDGINGKDGADGVKGDRGDQGEKGERGEKGDPGEPGAAGKDGAPGLSGKDGEPGRPGENGKDGAPGVAGLKGDPGPAGKDGAPGERGEIGLTGKDGAPGAPGERGEKGEPGIQGKDGAPGLNGKDGAPGLQGKDGAPGERGAPGIDGKSVTLEEVGQLLEGMVAKWQLDFERRAADTLDRAIDRMPKPKDGVDGVNGKDGADGLGFDDLTAHQKDDRTIEFVFSRGGVEKRYAFTFPVQIDRGTFKAGQTYERGDSLTYGGSIFTAQRATLPTEKPEDGSGAFRLAVKRGRDAS
jgi:hypothetical protein